MRANILISLLPHVKTAFLGTGFKVSWLQGQENCLMVCGLLQEVNNRG
jgi:hypothetical protein